MSAGTFIEGHTVHLPDVNGFPATIPARVLHLVADSANTRDDGRGKFGIRLFDRDALNGARDLLDGRADRCTFADQYVSCDELAGTHADGSPMTDLRDHPVCGRHLPDDDKDA